MHSGHALVVLPAGAHGRITDTGVRRWLSRGDVSFASPERELLHSVLAIIGAPIPRDGLAALRFWGQTGERSSSWMAAADPVHLQTRLRDLRIRALAIKQYSRTELRDLFATLQSELGADESISFAKLGDFGYLHAQRPLELPDVSAAIADGHVPDKFTFSGEAGKSFHLLLGEVQMLLHEHEVNVARQQAGLPSINSLWFWGGGVAPPAAHTPLPDLFSDDPLFNGYWASCVGRRTPWQGVGHCVETCSDGFVAVVPDPLHDDENGIDVLLSETDKHFRNSGLRRLTLLFRDGLTASLKKRDRWRFWRGIAPLLEEQAHD